MKNTAMRSAIGLALFLTLALSPSKLIAQTLQDEPKDARAKTVEPFKADEFIAKIKTAKDASESRLSCEGAIEQCKSYEDYEKLAEGIKRLVAAGRDYKYADVLYYALAKIRVEELSFLTKKNDIDSARVYMSVNEKYYNEALEYLDKVASGAGSKDLIVDACLLKFLVLKERFQPEKLDAAFNEMTGAIASYSQDTAQNIAKLNELAQKLSERGLADYAVKMKFAYASKVDPDSAKRIADDMKSGADRYFDEGNMKDALSTYDTYLQLAENYYDKDSMAAKLMDIAEKYFNKNRYKEAVKYYSLYLSKYASSLFADYAGYKMALAYYNARDYASAISKFESFLSTYQSSVWFEKGFESLCRLYYQTLDTDKAQESLQKLSDTYPRHDARDYAQFLIGILYYSKADYGRALEAFKKIQQDFPKSSYFYAADLLITDITDIKNSSAQPSFSFGSKDAYKMWEPYTPIESEIAVGEGAQVIENKSALPGEIFIKVKADSKIPLTINGLNDMDKFSEYLQDKEDESRLPKKIKDQTEKDLLFFTWSSSDSGKFLDDKQLPSRVWQAPSEPGDYTITVNIGDLALVRPPDSGSRKDPDKTLTIHVNVEK